MGRVAQGVRWAIDGGLAAAQMLLEAVLFAGAAAGLVFLLPGKFAVLVLSLYGFIVVWFLQAAALLVLAMMLMRALVSDAVRADAMKAVVLCGGFFIAVALCNGYVLMLGRLWGKDFAVAADAIPLSVFLNVDQRILAAALFHLNHPLLTEFVVKIDQTVGAIARTSASGVVAGLILAAWRRLAKGAPE